MISFFIRRGFGWEESNDLAQETFIRVYEGLGQFRGDGRLRDWLFRVAANTWKNRLRSLSAAKRKASEVPLSWQEAENETAPAELLALGHDAAQPQTVLKREQSEALRQAVLGLPSQMRRCVLLRLDQDLPYSEIAARLKLTTGTVKTHFHLAKRRLKDQLGVGFGDLVD